MQHTLTPTARSGFTLIELSIVLVIIGLIIGGVLVGQTLIESATQRKINKQAEEFRTAFNTYKLKYGFMPGDDPNAAQAFGADSNCTSTGYYGYLGMRPYIATPNGLTCSGGGNNKIDGDYSQEYELVWQHLALAKLIEGSYTGTCAYTNANCSSYAYTFSTINAPKVPNMGSQYNSVWVPFTPSRIAPWYDLNAMGWRDGGRTYFAIFEMSNTDGSSQPYAGTGPAWGLTPMLASALDKKYDDGIPNTGNVITYTTSGTTDGCVNVSSGVVTYHTSIASWYFGSAVNRGCGMMFSAGF